MPVAIVGPLGVALDRVIGCVQRARYRVSRARFGVHRRSDPSSSVVVGEEAAFDEPYNTRLHPTHGARSRAPRVPALRWYRDSARRG